LRLRLRLRQRQRQQHLRLASFLLPSSFGRRLFCAGRKEPPIRAYLRPTLLANAGERREHIIRSLPTFFQIEKDDSKKRRRGQKSAFPRSKHAGPKNPVCLWKEEEEGFLCQS